MTASDATQRHPKCGYPYCACVGQCFAASQPGFASDAGDRSAPAATTVDREAVPASPGPNAREESACDTLEGLLP
jgi:hypothetical protein